MKDHLQKALEGSALKVKDANAILQLILTAMIINIKHETFVLFYQ